MTQPAQAYPDTGHTEIDEQHRRVSGLLRELVEEVNAGRAAPAKQILAAAAEQIVAHFAFEERLMLEAAFPNLARHKEAHDTFVADAQKFAKELDAKGITPNFRRWAIGRLPEWFRFHIVANDVELGQFLLRRR